MVFLRVYERPRLSAGEIRCFARSIEAQMSENVPHAPGLDAQDRAGESQQFCDH